MNVSLTRELEAFIQKKVRSGRYSSASEVMREALRLLEEEDRMKATRLAELKKQLQHGVADLERGARTKFDAAAVKAAARKRRRR